MKNLLLIISLLFSLNAIAQEKYALLIIAHGSPSPKWNQPVLNIENQVKELLEIKSITGYDEVRVAMMEFAKPTITDVIRNFEKQGITNVYAIPLFIAPSGHSLFDIPAILGLSYDKEKVEELKSENIEIAKTDIKIILGPSLDYNSVMRNILLDKVKAISENPSEEALIILAHGDKNFELLWEELVDETGNYILGKTGIEYFDKAFVEVGQSFAIDGVTLILKASKEKNRVIVIGMYVSMGVKRMVENSVIVMMRHTIETKTMFEGKNIVFAENGLLPDDRISEWIAERAKEWLEK